MSFQPYPNMAALPAPESGDITSWGEGIVCPHITKATLVDFWANGQPTNHLTDPYCIYIESGNEQESAELINTLGIFPASAPYQVGDLVVQALLTSYYVYNQGGLINNGYRIFIPAPADFSMIGNPVTGNCSGEGEGISIYDRQTMLHEWYGGTWTLYYHALVTQKSHLSLTNIVAMWLLLFLLPVTGTVSRPQK